MSQKNDQPSQHDFPANDYSTDDIEVLSITEACRKRPGMHLQPAPGENVYHKLLETMLGHMVTHNVMHGNLARTIVTLREDNSAIIEDFGTGYEIIDATEDAPRHFVAYGNEAHQAQCAARYPSLAISELETQRHPTWEFSLFNALSASLTIEIRRDGNLWTQHFEKGEALGELELEGPTERTGTRITFTPDFELLGELDASKGFDFETAARDLERLAWMYPGLRLHLLEEGTMRTFEAYYPNGAMDILIKDHDIHPEQIFSLSITITPDNTRGLDLALAWRDVGALDAPADITSMVNEVVTKGHGSHVDGIGSGIMDALLHAAQAHSIQWKIPLAERGMVAAIRIQDVDAGHHLQNNEGQFSLASEEIESFVATAIAEHLEPWLEEHPYLVANLLERMASH